MRWLATQSQKQIWFCCELSDGYHHWIRYLCKWLMNFILLLRLEGFPAGFAITWVPGNLTSAAPSLRGNGDTTCYGDKKVEWSHGRLCPGNLSAPTEVSWQPLQPLRVWKERGEKASRVCRRIQSPCTCSSNRLPKPGFADNHEQEEAAYIRRFYVKQEAKETTVTEKSEFLEEVLLFTRQEIYQENI